MIQMKKSLTVVACVLSLGLCACSTHMSSAPAPSIKVSMQKMGQATGAAMKATTLTEFATHAQALREGVVAAGQNTYSGTAAEQALYKEGAAKLIQGLNAVDAKVAAGDLEAAKGALRALLPIRNQYHATLKK